MQQYQFERIYSLMEREFGKIRDGEEQSYAMLLFPIESNALKVHRADPSCNSRRFREAIALALFDIKSNYTGEEFALDKFRNEENEKFENAILMAFDPFTNKHIKKALRKRVDLTNREELHEYYAVSVMCLIRIKKSIDTWEKEGGENGYFNFLEYAIGSQIRGRKMDFMVMV